MKPLIHSIQSPFHIHPGGHRKENQHISETSFSKHLQQSIEDTGQLKVSKHARIRMKQRNIDISDATWDQIERKLYEAKSKGIQEPLVILKNAAMVVSAKNNTVITMMERNETAGKIFNNIDGTILLD
ncbi:TIGR02530 family flagellar biosynthesis protein [Siminovitchia sediminis]|uniref:TIGR02530 family flagellar biosynthesis protein n=1 Tax=Siminovitchia sediminis TaxID=1274353 RepID=A0ABW4KCH8_9BACI